MKMPPNTLKKRGKKGEPVPRIDVEDGEGSTGGKNDDQGPRR